MDDYPSNSRRPTQPSVLNQPTVPQTPPVVDDAVKLDQVPITGKVLKRKKSLGRRMMDTFFNGDSGVFHYLLKDVLVPALQATATDMVTQGIERAVYGEVRTTSRTRGGSTTGGRPHISYNTASTMRSTAAPAAPATRRPLTQPSSYEIGEFLLENKIDAQVIAEKLFETVEEYHAVSVANLCELMGQTSTASDHRWGWTDLTQMTIKRVHGGFLLVMPEPEDLR